MKVSHILVIGIGALITIGCIRGRMEDEERRAIAEAAKTRLAAEERKRLAAEAETARLARVAACQQDRAGVLRRAETARTFRDVVGGFGGLAECAEALADASLNEQWRTLATRHYVRLAQDGATPADERLIALRSLKEAAPAEHEKRKALESQLVAAEEAMQRRRDEEARRAELARRKREGVRIGMSEEEVLQSSWGRPRDVNRTTNARGTREQWVYPGGYLYFENGVLTTIQN